MKQNTRIARLIRNRRVKKLANFATVAMLICPLAIGTVNVLADTEITETTSETENVKVEETEVKDEVIEVEQTETPKQDIVTDPVQVQEEETITSNETIVKPEVSVLQTIPENKINIALTSSFEDLGIDTTEMKNLMSQTEYALANSDDYTPDSYTLFLAGGDNTPSTKFRTSLRYIGKNRLVKCRYSTAYCD